MPIVLPTDKHAEKTANCCQWPNLHLSSFVNLSLLLKCSINFIFRVWFFDIPYWTILTPIFLQYILFEEGRWYRKSIRIPRKHFRSFTLNVEFLHCLCHRKYLTLKTLEKFWMLCVQFDFIFYSFSYWNEKNIHNYWNIPLYSFTFSLKHWKSRIWLRQI